MILKIILFISILITSYEIAKKIIQNKSEINQIIKSQIKKISKKILRPKSILGKIKTQIEKAGIKNNILINPVSIAILSIILTIVSYKIIFQYTRIIGLSIIISIPVALIPLAIIKAKIEITNQKIEKTIGIFILQLKNYTKINNDIVYALNQVKIVDPLKTYISKFNLEIKNGIKFEKAIENLKQKISIKAFKATLTNIQYCYLHGGNYSALLDKSYETISQMQKEKENRITETKGARIVLLILIGLNILVYMNFIKGNTENYEIMTKSNIGTIIIYWNFISIWLLLYLSNKVKKLDY